MKTIGIIGGMSWESTVEYYRNINQEVRNRLGGHHSARIVLWSVDFAEIELLQRENRWSEAAKILVEASRNLERAGAECIVLATNTMHKIASEIAEAVQIPFLHIADVTAQAIQKAGYQKVGLLGTKFTMEQDFYRTRIARNFNIQTLVPKESDRKEIHRIIFDELCQGQIKESAKDSFMNSVKELQSQGAQGIILGCTEIGLLIKPTDTEISLFDSGKLHAIAAVDFAVEI